MSIKTGQWELLMATFPSDGWDGAADLIARHDAAVCRLESALDADEPGWHDALTDPPRRRTAERNEASS